MKRTAATPTLLAALALVAGTACGGESGPEGAATAPTGSSPTSATEPTTSTTQSASGDKITISLEEQNASGQTGTATLREGNDGSFEALIETSPPARFPGDSQNVHIHDVTCAEYAAMTGFNERLGTIVDWLPNLSKGRSQTTYERPLAERTTGTFSINVHEQNPPYTVVACGDIPKR
jgi:hypothetical protein